MSVQQIDTGTDELLCNVDERVATITLNRPEKRNALSDHLTPALRQMLFDIETRNDVGCIVITGAGTAFCAGGDVGGMGNSKTAAPHENGMAICLALLKLSDIHAILDAENNRNGNACYENGRLEINGKSASLAIPDWMLPLPRPNKK